MNKKVIMAAGGSGGHLFPALAAAEFLKNENYHVSFCGVDLKSNPFFPHQDYGFKSVFGSFFSKKTLLVAPIKLMLGFFQSLKYLYSEKPDFIIGFGSYHSFPATLAALFLRIPYLLFEPNLEMGKVNQLFNQHAKKVITYFDLNLKNQIKVLPPKKYQIFAEIEAKSQLGIQTNKPILLVLGGSQGSLVLNDAVIKIDQDILQRYFVIHIAGRKQNLESLKTFYQEKNIDALVLEFTERMQEILSITSLAISRAGASAIYEMLNYGIPTLFIPYGNSKNGHQVSNARYFCEKMVGGNFLMQTEISKDKINEKFSELEKNREIFHAHLTKNKNESEALKFDEFVSRGLS